MSENIDMSMFTTNNFSYSAQSVDTIGASESSLVSILVDVSGSVSPFKTELEDALKHVADACKKHPKAGNLMVRVATFGTAGIRELHGFISGDKLDVSSYKLNPAGHTPLYDAIQNAAETTEAYAKQLDDAGILTNAIFFVITDGEENGSIKASAATANAAIRKLAKSEIVDSAKSVLIGVNTDATVSAYLKKLKVDCGFDDLVDSGSATGGKLAKLANWVSQSISSTSQAVGHGASQSVAFVL